MTPAKLIPSEISIGEQQLQNQEINIPKNQEGRFNTETRTIQVEKSAYHFNLHYSKVTTNNLVVFIPGYRDHSEAQFQAVSTLLEQPFHSITFAFEKPFNIPNLITAIKKLCKQSDGKNIIFHANSLGGVVLNELLAEASNDPDFFPHIKGIVLRATPMSFEHLNPRAQKILQVKDERAAKAIAQIAKVTTNLFGGDTSQTFDTELTAQQLQAIPKTTTPITHQIPTTLILFEKDRLVNNSKLIATLEEQTGKPAEEFVIRIPSGKQKLGHEAQDWNAVCQVEAEIISGMLETQKKE